MDEKVKGIIADYLGVKKKKITLEMDLIEDLNINSYDVMSIVGRIEDEFNLEIPDEEIRNLKTVKDVVNYIEVKSKSVYI